MQKPHFTQDQLVQVAKLSDADILRINECRGIQNKIGFAYQLCFDWQMTDDAHRLALALIVNGIGGVEVTRAWGAGKTAARGNNLLVIGKR